MSAPAPPPLSERQQRRNVVALSAGNLCYACAFTLFYPYVSLIVRELGVETHLEAWVGIIMGTIFGLTFLLTPVWGSVADHFGKKSMVLRAGLGISAVFLLLALSPSLGWFVGFAVWIGLFNGYVASAMALTAATAPPGRTGRALAIVQTGSHVGGTLGPALGAALVVLLGSYQRLFYVSFALAFAAGLLALLGVREAHMRPTTPLRLHLIRDLVQLLRLPNLGVLFLLNFIFSFVVFGNFAVIAVYVLELMGDTPTHRGLTLNYWVGIASVVLTVGSAIALPVWGRILDRFEPGGVLALSLLLMLVCIVPVPLVDNPLQLAVARGALGALAAGMMPAVMQLTKARAPAGMDARALAFGTSLYMLGHGAAPVAAGLVGPLLGLRAYFTLNAVLVAAGLLLWLRSRHRHRAA